MQAHFPDKASFFFTFSDAEPYVFLTRNVRFRTEKRMFSDWET